MWPPKQSACCLALLVLSSYIRSKNAQWDDEVELHVVEEDRVWKDAKFPALSILLKFARGSTN